MKSVIKNLLQDISNQIYESGYCYAQAEFKDECGIVVDSHKDIEFYNSYNKQVYSDKYPNITDWIFNEMAVFHAEWEAKQDRECSECCRPIESGNYCSRDCFEASML